MARAKRRSNHEGSITRRQDGRYMARMTIGRDPVTGKLKRVCIYGKTRQEVAHQLAQDLSDMHRGSFCRARQAYPGRMVRCLVA